jgi:hypothetical protein
MASILMKSASGNAPTTTALGTMPAYGSLLIESAMEVVTCHEEKCLESGDRGRFYYFPVLFQSFDGRI